MVEVAFPIYLQSGLELPARTITTQIAYLPHSLRGDLLSGGADLKHGRIELYCDLPSTFLRCPFKTRIQTSRVTGTVFYMVA